ncbi:MAG: hypothetical protein ONB46_04850 [candidate division KSB1 bacterium]|nr:hypothetical protein [candidate division KSB1 bacterium]MDZ7365680.1 hypothetical protein [candidate division KSB1 bacterium]MDZ7403244.1 hypothetical protein [candidate division KSB1 bacterium]
MTDLHAWQLAFLKQARADWETYVKFMRVARNNHNLTNGLGMTYSQLKTHFNRLLPIANEIEMLAPILAQDGPNSEYPWPDKDGPYWGSRRILISSDEAIVITTRRAVT